MTRNRKIKEILYSDIYLELIKELGRDNFNKELQSVEIELDILKNHTDILADYYKRLRIPGAAKYARGMEKLYKTVFN
ncbi:MAG: hypothetical protein HXM02_08135 [[Eubacterium] sulci]|nr:hypothetical protein [[Eubacterium] sulci]